MAAPPNSSAVRIPLLHAFRNLHPAYPVKEWADLLLEDWQTYSQKGSFDAHRAAVVVNQAALIFYRLGDCDGAEALCRRLIDLLQAYFEESNDERSLPYAFQPVINLARIFNATRRHATARSIADLLLQTVNEQGDRKLRIDQLRIELLVRAGMQTDPDFVRFMWVNALIEGFRSRRQCSCAETQAFLAEMAERCPAEFLSLVDECRCILALENGKIEQAWRYITAERNDLEIQLIFLAHEAQALHQFSRKAEAQELLCKITATVLQGVLKHRQSAFELAMLRRLASLWTTQNTDVFRALVQYGIQRANETLDQREYRFFRRAGDQLGIPTSTDEVGRYVDYYATETADSSHPDGLSKLYHAIMTPV